MLAMSREVTATKEGQLSIISIVIQHLLPGAIAMALMLMVGPLFENIGLPPSVPVLFVRLKPRACRSIPAA